MRRVVIIIPMFNEAEGIPQLLSKLKELGHVLSGYQLSYIFVDDGSDDGTYEIIKSSLSLFPGSQVLRHEVNQNLGAALKTGLRSVAQCDYVCFLDSDCTYEPVILKSLLEALDRGADLSTVSPYHPKGNVEGVPKWRLALSKCLTAMYRLILRKKIYTFTAMVRAIRFDKMNLLINERNDFTFVAIGMIHAIKQGLTIEEIPATLHVRRFGVSKMKVTKTIISHLLILASLLRGKAI